MIGGGCSGPNSSEVPCCHLGWKKLRGLIKETQVWVSSLFSWMTSREIVSGAEDNESRGSISIQLQCFIQSNCPQITLVQLSPSEHSPQRWATILITCNSSTSPQHLNIMCHRALHPYSCGHGWAPDTMHRCELKCIVPYKGLIKPIKQCPDCIAAEKWRLRTEAEKIKHSAASSGSWFQKSKIIDTDFWSSKPMNPFLRKSVYCD